MIIYNKNGQKHVLTNITFLIVMVVVGQTSNTLFSLIMEGSLTGLSMSTRSDFTHTFSISNWHLVKATAN